MKLMVPARLWKPLASLSGGLFTALLLCSGVLFAMDDCWTSVSGPLDWQLTPAHGELGSESATIHPGIREKTVTWTGPDGCLYLFGGTSLDMTALSEVAHNDLWRFNPATDAWSWISGSDLPNQSGDYDPADGNGPTPGARSYAMAWTGADGKLYLFGGNGYGASGGLGLLNDLWRYDIATGDWTWLKGGDVTSQAGNYGQLEVADEANTPGSRQGSVTWTGADGKLYLLGGYGMGSVGEFGYLNDLWVFDPVTGHWTWLKGESVGNPTGVYGDLGVARDANMPGGRAYAVGWTVDGGALYLFGGARYVSVSDTGSFNDLWRYETSTNQWTWIKGSASLNEAGTYGQRGVADAGNNPPSRSYASAWAGPSGGLYLFGGLFYDSGTKKFSHKNDLWRFDPTTLQWTWRHGEDGLNEVGIYGEQGAAAAANTPGARSYASVWTDGEGKAFLYGGHGYRAWTHSDLLNDFWRYDPSDNQWTWFGGVNPQTQYGVYSSEASPDPAARPSARHNPGGWATPDGGLYLFGGRGLDSLGQKGDLNDLWRYETATSLWTWLGGDSSSGAYSVYGDRGVADPVNTPGARAKMAACGDDAGNGYLFGGQGLDAVGGDGRLNDLWLYDPASGLWTWLAGSNSVNTLGVYGTQGLANADNMPGGRRDAALWQGDDGNLYLFGGDGYGETASYGSLGDLWRYDTTTGQWTWLAGEKLIDQSGTYGTLGVADDDTAPGGRFAATAWTGGQGELYLYGGDGYDSQGNSGALSDLWRYDTATNQWTWLAGSDLSNQFGLYGVQGVADDDVTPGCRAYSMAWTCDDGGLYLFGGFSRADGDSYNQYYNDLWQYFPGTKQWMWLHGSVEALQPGVYGQPGISHPDNTPGARMGAIVWTAPDGRGYLFGGTGYDAGGNLNDLNDLWSYEPGRLAASGWSLYR